MLKIDENGNYITIENIEEESQTSDTEPSIEQRVEALENVMLEMIMGGDEVG